MELVVRRLRLRMSPRSLRISGRRLTHDDRERDARKEAVKLFIWGYDISKAHLKWIVSKCTFPIPSGGSVFRLPAERHVFLGQVILDRYQRREKGYTSVRARYALHDGSWDPRSVLVAENLGGCGRR